MNIESAILDFGYLAIFFLMSVNGVIGFPSSSLIYVLSGALVASGLLLFIPVTIAGTMGNILGNVILYELARTKGISYFTSWKIFSHENIQKLQKAFESKGCLIIFLGKLLSGVKIVIPIVAGVAQMKRTPYVIIISITSFMWATGLTGLGLYYGKKIQNDALSIWSATPLLLLIVAILLFLRYVKNVSLD